MGTCRIRDAFRMRMVTWARHPPVSTPQRHPWIEAGVRGLAAVDVRDFASDLGLHPDFSAGVLDGQ
jgi:hypothetical protein